MVVGNGYGYGYGRGRRVPIIEQTSSSPVPLRDHGRWCVCSRPVSA
ncbi:MAG: hypothetical protein MZV70_52185 [Desulfobacterales bacterium]|nr:hypothetical protein [Desulfobacterales bacterium]